MAIDLADALESVADDGTGIAAESVISSDSYRDREFKEDRIENSHKGLLSSVNIYREGVDLPWLDGIFFSTRPVAQYNMVQTFGRVLRRCEGKDIAKVYFAANVNELTKTLSYLKRFLAAIKIHQPTIKINFKILADEKVDEKQCDKIYENLKHFLE